MKRLGALVLLLLLPALANAQTVTVRSGEHGDFTRLVFTLPQGTTWSVDGHTEDRQVSVMFGPEPLAFDTSTVFDRIGTDRVSGLEAGDEGREMRISLACACDAEAFMLRDSMLVLDISPAIDGPGIAGPKESGVAEETGISPVIRDVLTLRVGDHAGIGPRPEKETKTAFLPVMPGPRPVGISDPKGHARDPDGGLGSRIAADLAIAATAGILHPAIRPVLSPAEPRIHAADPSVSPKSGAAPGDLTQQLAVGLNDVTRGMVRDGQISIGGETCIGEAALALSSWVDRKEEPNDVLASRRARIFGEFDRVKPPAVVEYSKALLYYGFGAEARAAMELVSEARDDVLVALSYLVDGETDPAGHFRGQARCDGPAALWSLLAEVPREGVSKEAIMAVHRSFESLPRALRPHLGPTLAERLAEAGEPMAAKEILRRTERMEGKETDSIKLGEAQIALRDGDLVDAGHRLYELSVSGGAEAARAVAASVDLAAAEGTEVPQRILELAEAYSTELRNSDDGPSLWQAHVRALHINGRFDDAFSKLRNAKKIPRETLVESKRRARKALVHEADDVTFLKIATRLLSEDEFSVSESPGLEFAQRFLALGLPEVALRQLDSLPGPSAAPERQFLRAEALLALDRPEEAEVILIGQRGPRVAELRAEARGRMGDHDFSRTLLTEVGEEKAAIDAAWLSGAWEDVAESETILAPAAGLISREPVAIDPANASLARVEAVSDAAKRSRETLRALLNATAVPQDNESVVP